MEGKRGIFESFKNFNSPQPLFLKSPYPQPRPPNPLTTVSSRDELTQKHREKEAVRQVLESQFYEVKSQLSTTEAEKEKLGNYISVLSTNLSAKEQEARTREEDIDRLKAEHKRELGKHADSHRAHIQNLSDDFGQRMRAKDAEMASTVEARVRECVRLREQEIGAAAIENTRRAVAESGRLREMAIASIKTAHEGEIRSLHEEFDGRKAKLDAELKAGVTREAEWRMKLNRQEEEMKAAANREIDLLRKVGQLEKQLEVEKEGRKVVDGKLPVCGGCKRRCASNEEVYTCVEKACLLWDGQGG